MKNSQLHELLHDLHGPTVTAPHAQARLRRTILNSPTRRSFKARFTQGFRLRNDPFLRSKQRYASFGTLVIALLFVTSFTAYTYKFSPKAAADQVIDQSLAVLSAVPATEIITIQEQLGGDPAAELKTAKQAKDVKVITKQTFVALGKNAGSVLSMSLNSDPTAPKTGSVTISTTAGGATMAKGTVSGFASTDSAPANATTSGGASGAVSSSGDVVYISSGTIAGAPGSVSASGPISGSTPGSEPSVGLPADGPTTIIDSGAGGISTMPAPAGDSASFATTSGTMSAMPVATSAMLNSKDITPFKIIEPSTYLQYTDSKGRTVVLSLDAKGIPIYKTIFLLKK